MTFRPSEPFALSRKPDYRSRATFPSSASTTFPGPPTTIRVLLRSGSRCAAWARSQWRSWSPVSTGKRNGSARSPSSPRLWCGNPLVPFARSSLFPRKFVAKPNPRQNRRSLINNRRHVCDRISLIEQILGSKVNRQAALELVPRKEINHVILAERQRIQIVIVLQARVPALNTEHDSFWSPVADPPGELVPWNFGHVFANQCRR